MGDGATGFIGKIAFLGIDRKLPVFHVKPIRTMPHSLKDAAADQHCEKPVMMASR
jgi:hypothetical protein